MSERSRFPKPEEFKLSSEAAEGIADFKRAMLNAGEDMARRANEAIAEWRRSTCGQPQMTGCVADPSGPCFKVDWLCNWCRSRVPSTSEGEGT